MYLLYLDESGCSNVKSKNIREVSNFFVLGGIFIKEENLAFCISKFQDFKNKNFPKEVRNIPIHAVELNQISRHKKSRYKDILTDDEGKELLRKTYGFLSEIPIEAIAILIDNHNLKKQYATPENPYKLSYKFILERFQKIIVGREEKHNQLGIVNLARAGKTQRALGGIHEDLLEKGTKYVKFDSIFRKLNIEKYENSPFFEFADLICYAYQRSYYAWLCKNLKKEIIDEEYLKILEKICTPNIGRVQINGIRLKVFPKPRFVDMEK